MKTELFRLLVNIGVALIVSVINYMIRMVFKMLSVFERYKSITHLNGAIMKKTFISTFINMGLLYLMINANFQGSSVVRDISESLPGGSEFFFNGDYSDLDRNWYSKVAISMIVLVITNLFSLLISSLIWELINLSKRKYFAKRQVLQHDMNS